MARESKYSVGKVFESNRNGSFEIIEALPGYKARIKFLNTGAESITAISNIARGCIKDPSTSVDCQDRYKIKIGHIYPTNHYGHVEVINRIDGLNVTVRFMDTGNTRDVRTSSLITGKVRDHSTGTMRKGKLTYGLKLAVGTVFKNSQGHAFEIVEFNGASDVRIRFVNTGTERTTSTYVVTSGKIIDYMEPSVQGVGYLGTEDYASIHEGAKQLWRGILRRATDETLPSTICERWLSMKNFTDDISFIPGYSKWLMWKNGEAEECVHLDKDFLFPGNTEYAPGKVAFISETDNTTEAMLRKYSKLHQGTEIGDHMDAAYTLLRTKILTEALVR